MGCGEIFFLVIVFLYFSFVLALLGVEIGRNGKKLDKTNKLLEDILNAVRKR